MLGAPIKPNRVLTKMMNTWNNILTNCKFLKTLTRKGSTIWPDCLNGVWVRTLPFLSMWHFTVPWQQYSAKEMMNMFIYLNRSFLGLAIPRKRLVVDSLFLFLIQIWFVVCVAAKFKLNLFSGTCRFLFDSKSQVFFLIPPNSKNQLFFGVNSCVWCLLKGP